MKLGPAQIRDLLIKSNPALGLGDFFLSGFDFHALYWGIRSSTEIQIDFVGGAEELSSGDGIPLKGIRIHESMTSFDEFLRSKPFEFQRFSYSLRLDTVFRGEISEQPREVRCTAIVAATQDRAHILELCLQFHVELSRLCKHSQFPVLSFQESVDLGFFRWLAQESFVAFLLSDLLQNSWLEEDFQQWLTPGVPALAWFEKEVQSRKGAWKGYLTSGADHKMVELELNNLKPSFLYLFLDTDFLEFTEEERTLQEGLGKVSDWWLDWLQGEKLSAQLFSDWMKLYRRDYLRAFVLCCMKTIYQHSLGNYSWIRLMEFIIESQQEEKLVSDFFTAEGFVVQDIDEVIFFKCLQLRWNGSLKTQRQFKQIDAIKKAKKKPVT